MFTRNIHLPSARWGNEQNKEAKARESARNSAEIDEFSISTVTTEEQLLASNSRLVQLQLPASQLQESTESEPAARAGAEEHTLVAVLEDGATPLVVSGLSARDVLEYTAVEARFVGSTENGNTLENVETTSSIELMHVVPELIEKVVTTSSLSWSMAGPSNIEQTVLLLTNGLAYIGLNDPPESLQLPASPDGIRWVSWRQDDVGTIYIIGASGEKQLHGVEVNTTPLTKQDIAGVYTAMNTATYGATMVTSWRDIYFNLNGTFELSKSTLTTTGGAGTILLDIFTSSFQQQTAGLSQEHIKNPELNNAAVPGANHNLYGTYELMDDGLTIEMRYANGTVEREVIYIETGFLRLGSSSYVELAGGKYNLENLQEYALRLEKGERVVWLSLLADSIMKRNRESFDTLALPMGVSGNTLSKT